MTSARDDIPAPSAGTADAALALVCGLAPLDRESRLASVRTVLERATRWAEEQDGVLLEFPEAGRDRAHPARFCARGAAVLPVFHLRTLLRARTTRGSRSA